MKEPPEYTIDRDVLAGYNAGIEAGRLASGLGLIEFARTKEILAETLPASKQVIYDIGGGPGEYSRWLAAMGHEVHLFDISPTNIQLAQAAAKAGMPGTLAAMEVADARAVDRHDGTADAVLLMGPLYHIVERRDRLLALRESLRLLKPGGLLFAAGITRYATLLWAISTYGSGNRLLDEPEYRKMVSRDVLDGQHIRHEKFTGMGRSFYHNPDVLAEELTEAGFSGVDVRGVVGPGWLAPNLDALWMDEKARESILFTVRLVEREPSLLGLSTHLLAVARKPV